MKIAIIGAGVGGILALQLLHKKLPDVDFVLIDDNNFFVFTPRLTEILSEMIPEKYTVRPTKLFEDKDVHVIISKVQKVDLKNQEIYLDDKKVSYDIIVFAQGARTNFFGLKNVQKYCFQFKDYHDTKKIRRNILHRLYKLEPNKNLSIALVGGGSTGTELAFALRDLVLNHRKDYPKVNIDNIKISIYQSSDTLVKDLNPWIIKKAEKEAEAMHIKVHTNHRVIDVQDNTLFFKGKDSKKADVIIWVAGVIPNIIEFEPEIKLEYGCIPVRNTLQLIDFKNAFAIGDCSCCLDSENKPYPKTAQIAAQHAYYVSDNIESLIKNQKLKQFTYKIRGFFLALGNHKTAARIHFLKFNGILGWLLRDFFYKYIFKKLVKGK